MEIQLEDISVAMFQTLQSSSPIETLLSEGAKPTITEQVEENKTTTRRGARGKKFKGEHLICCTDVWLDGKYVNTTSGIEGSMQKCTREVNTHPNNDAWDLVTSTGVILCFIAKEHGLNINNGDKARLSHVIDRKGFKGATLRIMK